MAGGNKIPKSKLRAPRFNNGVRSSPYDPNRFDMPHPALGAFTITLVLYLAITTISANSLPDFLWPFAQFSKYMASQHFNVVIGFCCFTVIAHCLEAAYAGKVCQDRRYSLSTSMKWVLSIFIFGFPSMIRLLSVKPRSKST